MANEATVRSDLSVLKGNLVYRPRVTSFKVDVTGSKGPTPGYILVPTIGINVLLDQLTVPGLFKIRNLDTANYVEVGIHDGSIFHPFLEIGPGEEYVGKFSRNLLEEEDVYPGTGTTGNVNYLFFKANTAACGVEIDVFEK